MKINILILFTLLNFTFVKAQNSVTETKNPGNISNGSISGKVVDKKTNEAIPYASVTIKDGAKIVSGGITKENGTFNITNLPLQELTIEVQFMGYKKHISSSTLTSDNKSINLKNITLEEETNILAGVEIVRERSSIEQKADKKVITIGKDLIASGTTASEMFNNIPTVNIDPQTKELSLRGNSNVRVLIDGKPSNIDATQLLQQIPSSSIKQIELITNPSAKYNPEGMSGIINIILHKNANTGFNGSINSGVTFGITPKTNQSLNLNYKVGKVNFYTNYGFNHGKNANYGFVDSDNPTIENHQDFNFDNINTSHLIKFGTDYYINDNNTLSFFTSWNSFDGKGNSLTQVNYFDNSNPDERQINTNNSGNITQTYDLSFKHNFKKKDETIDFQMNHSITNNEDLANFSSNGTLSLNDITGKTKYTQFNIDYVNPLTEKAKLELGYESRIQSGNNLFFDTSSTESANITFDFNRNIHALYANLSRTFGKFSAQVGVRGEHYKLFAHPKKVSTIAINNENIEINDQIITIYPSTYLSYKLDDKNTFNLNYTRRVDRPSNGQINPIREWSTPLLESRGNPALEPQFTNSFELNYTKTTKIGSITSAIFYRLINAEISRVIYPSPNSSTKNILSYDNFKNNQSLGAEINANLKLTKWWSTNASADVYFKTVRGTVTNIITKLPEQKEVDVTTFNARINNTFTATKYLKFNLFAMYKSKDLGLQFLRTPMYKVDLGANYSVLKGKGTISIRSNDIFDLMHFGFKGNIPYRQDGEFHWESRTLYLGFNYNFGGGKNKALQRKQRDANETQGGGGMM